MPPASIVNSLKHSAGILVIWNESELPCCLCQIGFNKNVCQALTPKQTNCLQKLKIQNNELFLAKFV